MADISLGRTLGPGTEIADFVIVGVAGAGGMGVVYRARQRQPDRIVALKVIAAALADDPSFGARFRRESTIAAQIEHPNVIPVHAVGEAGGVLYIAMRFVAGTDLRRLLTDEGRLEQRRAAVIVDQVAQALDAAHAHGLVHRDVKPANILIAAAGGRDHVYLSDFGVSRHIEGSQALTGTGAFIGTIDYVSPEQARGDRVDARSDVYSLGCVLFEALSGTVPFPFDNDLAKLYAHDSKPPPSVLERNPDITPAFDPVLKRAMAKWPDDRYRSAGDLGRAAIAAAYGEALPGAERSVAVGEAAPEAAAAPTRGLGASVPTAAAGVSTRMAQATQRDEARGTAAGPDTQLQLGASTTFRKTEPAPGARARFYRRPVVLAAAVAVAAGVAIAVSLAVLGPHRGRSKPALSAGTTAALKVPSQYPTIQAAVDAARSGETIDVAGGSFSQQVTISKNLTLKGTGTGSTTIGAPKSLAARPIAGQRSIVTVVGGARVSIENLTIAGPRAPSCTAPADLNSGILVAQGATLELHSAAVTNVRDTPANCVGQETQAIAIGLSETNGTLSSGHATISNDVVSGYGDEGIAVVGSGSTATISSNRIIGLGGSPARFVIGVIVHGTATATITHNTITDNRCTSVQGAVAASGKACGSGPQNHHGQGILVYKAGSGTVITSNKLSGNDVGIQLAFAPLCCTVSHNTLAGNLFFGELVKDGSQTMTGERISGGQVGIGVVADKTNATVTLQGVTITNTSLRIQTYSYGGYTAHVAGSP